MTNLVLEVGRTYFPQEGPLITIRRVLDDNDLLREKGYVFGGRYQGGVHEKYFDESGKSNLESNQVHSDDLVKEITSEQDVVDSLWDQPGQSLEQLLKGIESREERLFIQGEMLDKLINSNRVSVLRFTSYAPSLRTTFFYFATEHGRLEILDNTPWDFAGFQIGHVHDPMNLWDVKMKEASKD